MEHIHGIDVSWMTHESSKDNPKFAARRRNTLPSQPTLPQPSPTPLLSTSPRAASPMAINNAGAHGATGADASHGSAPIPISSSPPVGGSLKLQRRGSWFSSLSSKFSSSNPGSPPQAAVSAPKQTEPQVIRANPVKNAVLQHAAKHEGEGPYTPAPVKTSSQAGLFHVLRRLSSSSSNGPSLRNGHGLVERRVLNVDRNRERCRLAELDQNKLRRVAFCVDVEIAPMPKYSEAPTEKPAVKKPATAEKAPKLKTIEMSEGEALKSGKAILASEAKEDRLSTIKEKEPLRSPTKPPSSATANGTTASTTASTVPIITATTTATATATSTAAATVPTAVNGEAKIADASTPLPASAPATKEQIADANRKKEKKKKSEEERKARKERRRRLAEANGSIPMEIYLDSDESDDSSPATPGATANGTAANATAAKAGGNARASMASRAQLTPTTNPVRIYRRCCQLRETPILKRITEQLTIQAGNAGVVEKLDLTGYWMHLADLITLGDFLAVVPIREVILENCGLTDEGLRVILAGLLAARVPEKRYFYFHHRSHSNLALATGAASRPAGVTRQSGFIERLVLKNNKIGPDGWKHICVFLHMCRSLKFLDLSSIAFPQPPAVQQQPQQQKQQKPPSVNGSNSSIAAQDLCKLFSKSLGERLGGSTLELLNLGDTGLTSGQLGLLIDGLLQCGTKRLGVSHNDFDDDGVKHVARYLASDQCEAIDLCGNDLRDWIETLADAVREKSGKLWALSLADCNLKPAPLCKLLAKLATLNNFRFLDLSRNHDLFETQPSALPSLRRYLPLMTSLKRLHLADVGMTSSQAIAIAEIIPEIKELAHLNLLENPELVKLADARTEETQEQACALYASLLAATRLSTSLVAVDIDIPTAESSEIVRAMAKQVLAYCLRNVDLVTTANAAVVSADALEVTNLPSSAAASIDGVSIKKPAPVEYPNVIQHLVGHDAADLDTEDEEVAPDDDYVIGGTGVAQALECCLNNRGSESARPSGEFARETDGTVASSTPTSAGKAKDMSKHLLQSARKIRIRLQPALQKAKALSEQGDNQAYQRLLFLDHTLDGIIKRFENEFPETRVSTDSVRPVVEKPPVQEAQPDGTCSQEAHEGEVETAPVAVSDGEDETDIRPTLSRSNSSMSLSSKGLTNEEGRVLRAGHRFRSGWLKHYNLLTGTDDIGVDPEHQDVLLELVHEINNEDINRKLAEKGLIRLFNEDRKEIFELTRAQDPEYWDRFVEAQEKARANLHIGLTSGTPPLSLGLMGVMPEEAIEDDVKDS